ncbi:MAG: hypothetical protein IPM13_18065, partial [Phycisphaerales bacterium]|nr:hypothetical protein [Phycisphaerales bacterium]
MRRAVDPTTVLPPLVDRPRIRAHDFTIVGGPPGRSTSPAPEPLDLGWRFLALGLVLAWGSGFVLPGSFTWFLAAIPHEMGHATVGCLLGHPSAPAISLRGEAWTGIAEQRPFLVWAIALIAAACAYGMRHRTGVALGLGALALLVPAIAFNEVGEAAILVAGHGGELAFATYCFYLAVTGGRTGTPQERTASAMAGALLQFVNLKLCVGLIVSAEAREWYATNGSVGLVNDYLRLANDVFGCSLQAVAGAMLLVGILPLPLGVVL